MKKKKINWWFGTAIKYWHGSRFRALDAGFWILTLLFSSFFLLLFSSSMLSSLSTRILPTVSILWFDEFCLLDCFYLENYSFFFPPRDSFPFFFFLFFSFPSPASLLSFLFSLFAPLFKTTHFISSSSPPPPALYFRREDEDNWSATERGENSASDRVDSSVRIDSFSKSQLQGVTARTRS